MRSKLFSNLVSRVGLRTRSMIIDGVFVAGAAVIRLALPFITIPFTLAYLGTERFGVWMAVSSLAALITLLEAGMANALVTIAARTSDGTTQSLRFLADSQAASYVVVLSFSFAGTMIAILLAPLVDWHALLNLTQESSADNISLLVIVLTLITLVQIVTNVSAKVQIGVAGLRTVSRWDAAGSLLSLPALALAIHVNASILGLALALMGPITLTKVARTALFHIQQERYRPSLHLPPFHIFRETALSATPFVALTISTLLLSSGDQFLFAVALSANDLAEYAVIKKIYMLIFTISHFVMIVQWPTFARELARGEKAWVIDAFKKTLILLVGLSLSAGIALTFVLPSILIVWPGISVANHIGLSIALTFFLATYVAKDAVTTLLLSMDVRRILVGTNLLLALTVVPGTFGALHYYGRAGGPVAQALMLLLLCVIPSIIVALKIASKAQSPRTAPSSDL